MDPILRGALIRGVADYDIKLAILQDKNQRMSLEEAFQFIEAKEAGKRSASKLLDSQEVAASRLSQYRRLSKSTNNNTNTKPPPKTATVHTGNQRHDNTTPCTYCGKVGHGAKAKPDVRMKKCPAYNMTCTYCSLPHHLEECCRKKLKSVEQTPAQGTHVSDTSQLYVHNKYDQLCAVSITDCPFPAQPVTSSLTPNVTEPGPETSTGEALDAPGDSDATDTADASSLAHNVPEPSPEASTEVSLDAPSEQMSQQPPTPNTTVPGQDASIEETSVDVTTSTGHPFNSVSAPVLDHHVYDAAAKMWVKKRSQPHPFLHLDISVHPEDYYALNLPEIFPTVKSGSLNVMADTGCQCCLISYKLLRQLGIFKQHLIPASMQMKTATCGMIDIIGCILLRLKGKAPNGRILETRQVVYVRNWIQILESGATLRILNIHV